MSKILGQCEEKLKEFLERYVDKIFNTSFARDEVVVRRSVRVIVFAPPFLTTIFFMRFFSTFLGLNDSSSKKTTVAMNKFSGDASGIDQMGRPCHNSQLMLAISVAAVVADSTSTRKIKAHLRC